LTLDAAGNLYGAAPFDGNDYFASGVVFQLSPGSKGWTEHVLHQFGKGFDGSGPTGALILDSAGNVYGPTDVGGTGGVGTIFELSPASDGEWIESLASSPPPPLGFTPSFKPDSKSERRFIRNIGEGR
jgi:hypothetical protein